MLIFDNHYAPDAALGVVLWADGPKNKRVRFYIGPTILMDVLGGGNPVNDDRKVQLCNENRARIQAACRRAFIARPGDRVELTATDFA